VLNNQQQQLKHCPVEPVNCNTGHVLATGPLLYLFFAADAHDSRWRLNIFWDGRLILIFLKSNNFYPINFIIFRQQENVLALYENPWAL